MNIDVWTEAQLPLDHLIALQKVKLGITKFKVGDQVIYRQLRRTYCATVTEIAIDFGILVYDLKVDFGGMRWGYEAQLTRMSDDEIKASAA